MGLSEGHERYRSVKICILLMILFLIIVLLFFPFRFVFEFNPDEGLELTIADMGIRGYDLYEDIHIDQPPAFHLLEMTLFRLMGPSVLTGRLLGLGFSTILVGSVALFLTEVWGSPHALAGVLMLLLLPYFLQLSVSVMIGLPAIALAMASLTALLFWHLHQQRRWLILSGLLLGLSIMMKLFTILLVPLACAGILFEATIYRGKIAKAKSLLTPALIWSFGLALGAGPIALMSIGPANLVQLLQIHLDAVEIPTYVRRAQVQNIDYYLQYSIGVFLLGALGALRAAQERKWPSLYFFAWAGAAYLALRQLVPTWYHHQLLVTVPAAVLGGIVIGESLEQGRQVIRTRRFFSRRAALALLMLAVSGYIVVERIPSILPRLRTNLPNFKSGQQVGTEEFKVLAIMSEYRERTELIVTDRPMYAFRLRKEVPPELAVFSEKRLYAGELTEDQVLATIRAKRPAQVLFTRFTLGSVESYLREEYEAAYISGKLRLYLRPDLLTDS